MDRLTLISRLAGIITLATAGAKDDDLTLAVQQLAVERGTAQRLQHQHHQPTLPDVPTAAAGVPQEIPLTARIQLVFDYWKSRTGHVSARLLPERARHIRARLKDFSTVDLCDAIDGCVASDFHTGTNDRGERYDWIENIMHNGTAVEKHIARARRAGAGALRDLNPETAKLRAELDRAMKAGDVTASNELNRRLAAALRGAAQSGR